MDVNSTPTEKIVMSACLAPSELREVVRPLAGRLSQNENPNTLSEVVQDILACAQAFVPCEAGSLMLRAPGDNDALIFVASFGVGADKLPGTVLPAGTGISSRAFLSGKPVLTNTPDSEQQFYKGIDDLTEHTTRSLLSVPLKAFGESVGVLNLLNRSGGHFQDKDLDLLKIFSQHLTQSIQLMMEAKRQRDAALRDHLTGLYNDRYLYQYLTDVLEDSVEKDQNVGLIFLDLDHFKAVVDTHGHLVGSQALREFGILIGRVASRFEGMPARYGGDEYVVVVRGCSHDELNALATDLREIIEMAVIECEGEEGAEAVTLDQRITASIGVVCLSQLEIGGKSVETLRKNLIRHADNAMYKAKELGKNRIYWHAT